MTKRAALISLTLLLVASVSFGQTQKRVDKGGYIIDSSIKQQVDKKVKISNDSQRMFASTDFRMFLNDSKTIDTYSTDSLSKRYRSFWITGSSLERDTIRIVGYYGLSGHGYQITLFKNACAVNFFAKENTKAFKLHRNDSLASDISIPCKTYKLTLSQKPTFKKGEVLYGFVELTSEDYYGVNKGKETKFKIQVSSYFKTLPLTSPFGR